MTQDHSGDSTLMRAAHPAAGSPSTETPPARAEAGVANLLASGSPDVGLIALGGLFAIAARCERSAIDSGDDAEADRAGSEAETLARYIAALPASTVGGMQAKLRVAAFYGACDPDIETGPEKPDYPGEAAIRSLYRDVPGIEISTNPSDIRLVEVASGADPILLPIRTALTALDAAQGVFVAHRKRAPREDLPRAWFEAIDVASALFRETVFTVTPTTLEGCQALAGAVLDLMNVSGFDLEDDMPVVLRRIAGKAAAATEAPPAADGGSVVRTDGATGSDTELLALVERFYEADRAYRAAHTDFMKAEAAAVASEPARPDAMRRADDFRHFSGAASNPASPEFYLPGEIERLRGLKRFGHTQQRGTDAALARAAEIGAAFDRWQVAVKANDAAHGLPDADARCDATLEARDTIRDSVCALPATTLAGLIAKAKVAKTEGSEHLAITIRDDLLALGEVA